MTKQIVTEEVGPRRSFSKVTLSMLAIRELINRDLHKLSDDTKTAIQPGIHSPAQAARMIAHVKLVEDAMNGFEVLVGHLSAADQRRLRAIDDKDKGRRLALLKNAKTGGDERKRNMSPKLADRDKQVWDAAEKLIEAGRSERELAGIIVKQVHRPDGEQYTPRTVRDILKRRPKK